MCANRFWMSFSTVKKQYKELTSSSFKSQDGRGADYK